MSGEAFVDSNILIYAAAGGQGVPEKWEIAHKLLEQRQLVLSAQVLAEFFSFCRRKKLIPIKQAESWLLYLSSLECLAVDRQIVLDGARICERYQTSYWDAALIAASRRMGVEILYTEDLNHGQNYGSVRACNPFIEDFLA